MFFLLIPMTKRTSPKDMQNLDDAQDLDVIVVDKRSLKRANGEKRRRRNRRYENRLLNLQANLQVESLHEIEISD
jgi:hypothetical protein